VFRVGRQNGSNPMRLLDRHRGHAWIVGLVSRIGSWQSNGGASSVEWLACQTIAIAIVVLLSVSSAALLFARD
jgi:hypothetical protein